MLLALPLLLAAGCGHNPWVDGGVGAATGAVLGKQVGGNKGAIVGGALGAAAGVAIGSEQARQRRYYDGYGPDYRDDGERYYDDGYYDDDHYRRRDRYDRGW